MAFRVLTKPHHKTRPEASSPDIVRPSCVSCEVRGSDNVPALECEACGMALCATCAAEPCAPKCVAALHKAQT